MKIKLTLSLDVKVIEKLNPIPRKKLPAFSKLIEILFGTHYK